LPPGSAVYVLAAWRMPPRRDLRHEHLSLRWDVFRGYQRDVSLLPLPTHHLTRRWGNVPITLVSGTFRLVYAPSVSKLPRGWYSLAARAILAGPHCPKAGCSGQVRQTRFYTY